MLVKIILKNYRVNSIQYLSFYICNIVTLSVMFAFWGIVEAFLSADTNKLFLEISGELVMSGVIVTVITILMMFYSLKSYVLYRLKDYSMMLVLGMRKKRFFLTLGLEYFLGCICSFAAALLLGNLLLWGMTVMIRTYFLPDMPYAGGDVRVWILTFVTGLALSIIVFMVLATWLENKDAGNLMSLGKTSGKYPKSHGWLIFSIIGVVFLVMGYRLYKALWWYWVYAHGFWIAAIALILLPLGGLILRKLKKKKEFYFHHLLRLNTLYSRYLGSFGVIFTMVVIHFFVLGFAGNLIAGRFPLEQGLEQYPYDCVWMARDTDRDYAEEVTEKYNGKMDAVPMFRVMNTEFTEWIGISESDYERLTGEKIRLGERDVLVSEPSRKTKKRQVLSEKPREIYLFPGKYTKEHESDIMKQTVSGNFRPENTFREVAQVSENVFGDYTGAVYATSTLNVINAERVVVFSDTYFKQQYLGFEKNQKEPTQLLAFVFPEKGKEEACSLLKKKFTRDGLKGELHLTFGDYPQENFYITEEILQRVEQDNLFVLLYGVGLGGYLFCCSLLLYIVKLMSDFELFRRKYEVLNHLGMRWKEQKKAIRGEILADARIASIAAVVFSCIYIVCSIQTAEEYGRALWDGFFVLWLLFAVLYCGLNWLVSEGIVRYMEHKIKKERV